MTQVRAKPRLFLGFDSAGKRILYGRHGDRGLTHGTYTLVYHSSAKLYRLVAYVFEVCGLRISEQSALSSEIARCIGCTRGVLTGFCVSRGATCGWEWTGQIREERFLYRTLLPSRFSGKVRGLHFYDEWTADAPSVFFNFWTLSLRS